MISYISRIYPQRAPSLGEVSATVRRLAEVIADSVNRPIDQTRENLKTTAFALNSIASFARMQPVADNTV